MFSGFDSQKKSSYIRGNIYGKVVDSISGKALEFANISVTNSKWNKIIEGTISDENGKFTMTNILTGSYILKIKYLGYNLKQIEFQLTKKKPDFNFKNIKLTLNS
jgi:uncharacterized surface anchored protein